MTPDTNGRVRKLPDASPLAKLCRMLQSMSRRFPQGRLSRQSGGFGVSLDASTSMLVSFTGRWTAEDMRDCLALFATWCVADPERIMGGGDKLTGVLQTVTRESEQSSTRQV